MRSEKNWKAWFERREANKNKKTGRRAARNRKERTGLAGVSRSGVSIPRVVGELPLITEYPERSWIREFPDNNPNRPTPAEYELRRVLEQLNGGVLRGRFKCQYAISGKWIVDFFFPEIRLAIDVDGSIRLTEKQREQARQKEADCARFDITMLRVANREVYGDRESLIEKLRSGWREALGRENRIIGMDIDEYLNRFR